MDESLDVTACRNTLVGFVKQNKDAPIGGANSSSSALARTDPPYIDPLSRPASFSFLTHSWTLNIVGDVEKLLH